MINIKLILSDAKESLIQEMLNRIIKLKDEMNPYIYKLSLSRESTNAWELNLRINYIFRNKQEVNLVFGEGGKLNLLSKLLNVDIFVKESTKTKFTRDSIIPITIFKLDFDVALNEFILEHDFEEVHDESEFAYLTVDKLSGIKPWETYLDLMKRLSPETRKSILLTIVTDFTAMDCVNFTKLKTDQERIQFIKDESVHRECVEFFEYMLTNPRFDQKALFETITYNANRTIALNNILKDDVK